jgi:hypothetical protein
VFVLFPYTFSVILLGLTAGRTAQGLSMTIFFILGFCLMMSIVATCRKVVARPALNLYLITTRELHR